MTTASVILQNLAYVIGAVVAIVIGGIVVTLRYRKPKSVEANMASFHRGLRALAPDAEPVRRQHTPPPAPPAPSRARTVHTVLPTRPPPDEGTPGPDADPGDHTTTEAETG